MEPVDLANQILEQHERGRARADQPWRWADDPDGSALAALAAQVKFWRVDGSAFEARLERLIRLPTGSSKPAAQRMLQMWRSATGATATQELPLLLIVEDDPAISALISHSVRGSFRVVHAETGAEGLAAAVRESPDVITLDLMLPDGHAARILAALKREPRTADIPVVVLSAYTGGLRSLDRSQAAAVLTKPFGPVELLDVLRTVVAGA
ncbi:MAG: response regulator [Chloroflexota bacterium]